jgi:hypothetical protein
MREPTTQPGPTLNGAHLSSVEAERSERHARRFGARLVAGAVIGALIGVGVGLVVGTIVFDRSGPTLTSGLAGLIAFGGIGAFWGGMAGLESPDPTREPTQTDEPLDEPTTRLEQDLDGISRPGG